MDMIEAFYPSSVILNTDGTREKHKRFPLGPHLPLFHMGGDEVNFGCWATDSGIRSWLKDNGYPTSLSEGQDGFLKLWSNFQGKALELLKNANGALKSFKHGVMIWTSQLTKPPNIVRQDAATILKIILDIFILYYTSQDAMPSQYQCNFQILRSRELYNPGLDKWAG